MTTGVFTAKSVCEMYVQWCQRVGERVTGRGRGRERGAEGDVGRGERDTEGERGREKQEEGETQRKSWREWEGRFDAPSWPPPRHP